MKSNVSQKLKSLSIFTSGILIGIILFSFNNTKTQKNDVYAASKSASNPTVSENSDPDENNYFKYYSIQRTVYTILNEEFVDPTKVTAKKLIYGAIKGMLAATEDPYTVFLEPQATEDFNIDISGSFGGLGIRIGVRDNWLTVVTPLEDTPAWRAGLKPNDKIVEIEGKTTEGMSVTDAVKILRGEPGTKVTITIRRMGMSETFPVTITRAIIKLKTVKYGDINYKGKTFSYIKMIEFSSPTAKEFLTQLTKLNGSDADGLIIDLRYNPGGLLSVVIDCVNYFYSKGLIVYTRGRSAEDNAEARANSFTTIVDQDIPIVVLINEGSASASEIFAGAMQDTGRAVLVGTQSFGKGSVQTTYEFPSDGTMIKYTIAKYYTPAGRSIDGCGLTPDVEEKMWYETLSTNEQKAIIKLQQTNFVKDFVYNNPDFDENDVKQFRNRLKDEEGLDLSFKALEWIVSSKKSESELPKLYNLKYDNQLEKALEVLGDYSKYQKNFRIYEEVQE